MKTQWIQQEGEEIRADDATNSSGLQTSQIERPRCGFSTPKRYSTHKVPSSTPKARACQRLSVNGGRVCEQPRKTKPEEEKAEEDRSKTDDLRGSPMSIGNLEELIDENHAIVSSLVGLEYYVGILSFVDKDQLEPNCTISMHNKVHSVVWLLQDEVDPLILWSL